MNASELAIKMLQWEEKKNNLDELEQEIKDAVLEIGKTQTVGNVRASLFRGKKRLNYQLPAEEYAPQSIIEANSSMLVDWRQVCKDAGIEPLIESQGDPIVRVKLLE